MCLQVSPILLHHPQMALQSRFEVGNALARAPRSIDAVVPPHAYFVCSAVFHNLGPAFAVLLFTRLEVAGVAWLRIAAAAIVLCLWRRPWRLAPQLSRSHIVLLAGMGLTMAVMNLVFYYAIGRIPLAVVSAIECLGPVGLAAWGARSLRNAVAVSVAATGAMLLTGARLVGDPMGVAFAFANAALFTGYIVLGHRLVRESVGHPIDRLAIAMAFALVFVTPMGLLAVAPALRDARLLAAAIGVGICSSVIPYICDQRAMARLPRSSFALLLLMIPATAALIGALVLRQFPSLNEMIGIVLIVGALALHREVSQVAVSIHSVERCDREAI